MLTACYKPATKRWRYAAYYSSKIINTSSSSSSSSPVEKYKSFVKKGVIRFDNHQLKALNQLNTLHEQLLVYEEQISATPMVDSTTAAAFSQHSSSWFSSIFSSSSSSSQPNSSNNNVSSHNSNSRTTPVNDMIPKSFYIYGGTGTGKTFLMDLFYENLTFVKRRRRIHYSNFMLDIHQRLHALKMARGSSNNQKLPGPIRARGGGNIRASKSRSSTTGESEEVHEVWEKIASDIYKESYLICLDEFQVTDIADAVILKNLFASLFDKGVVVIMTSNRPPKDLYQNGLQRELFLPFIELVQKRATVHSIVDSTTDYRVLKQKEQQGKVSIFFFCPGL